MLPLKKIENVHTVIAILVLFEQVFGKNLFKYFAPNSECFTKYDTIFDLYELKAQS